MESFGRERAGMGHSHDGMQFLSSLQDQRRRLIMIPNVYYFALGVLELYA